MLIPLLANRAMLSADKVSMVTMVCWSAPPSVPAAGEMMSVETAELLVTAGGFLFRWVLMCFERWSLRIKRLGHSLQANFFSPETGPETKTC